VEKSAERVSDFRSEVERGERFEFGKNWRAFLAGLTDTKIDHATSALKSLLQVEDLKEKSFVDIGSGSGLSSLAAFRLGAKVCAFDFDNDSVACTRTLKSRYAATSDHWRILQGSALDASFLSTLGTFDVVYSWGVLHHTGRMYPAIENSMKLVAPGGLFAVAIYNDQGAWSPRWAKIKRFYCSGPLGKTITQAIYIPYQIIRGLAADLVWLRNPWARYRDYSQNRGMSIYHDWIDWLGGHPFEYAKPEEIFHFFRARGFSLVNLETAGGSVGCNQFVFRKNPA
jgi:SAM-dependent methyltransferase